MRLAMCAVAAALITAACNPNAETDNTPVATDESVAERQADAPAAGANSFTEEQARQHLINRGYTDPSGLVQAEDGTWRGTARRDGQLVQVTVDYQGNVTTGDQGSAGQTGQSGQQTTTP